MTNHWIDLKNADVILAMGGNPASNHPISMKWMMRAREKGAKRAQPLPVSAPFHCALMGPAADAMAEALAAVEMRAPVVPLVANVTARPLSDPDEIQTS